MQLAVIDDLIEQQKTIINKIPRQCAQSYSLLIRIY